MTTDDMNVIQSIICDKVGVCKDCPFSEKTDCCFGIFSPEDEDMFFRVISFAMELTDSPAIKRYLSGFMKAEVI